MALKEEKNSNKKLAVEVSNNLQGYKHHRVMGLHRRADPAEIVTAAQGWGRKRVWSKAEKRRR